MVNSIINKAINNILKYLLNNLLKLIVYLFNIAYINFLDIFIAFKTINVYIKNLIISFGNIYKILKIIPFDL